ncbi:hypothetical protein D1872_297310 [compost metagenome]
MTNRMARSHSPEKIGICAIACANPTLNGFSSPAVNPQEAPSEIMAVPVNASNFNARAMAIPIGTNTITSVDIPMVKPPTENKVINTGMTHNPLLEKDLATLPVTASIVPEEVII